MKKLWFVIFFSVSTALSYSQDKTFPRPMIEFNPPKYICYRTETPIIADGKLTEKIWEEAEWTTYFIDIEGNLKPRPRFKTRAKMLWDDQYLYISAQLEEPHLWATLKQRDTIIFYDNDFEIFIDPDGDTHGYYELEINAFKTAWDLFLVKPYRDSGGKQAAYNSWDIPGLKLGVALKGTLNDPGDMDEWWACEIAIPWKSLRENFSALNTPKAGEQWRINFSRVEWKLETIGGKYQKKTNPETGKAYPEDNWVWAPTGLINIHYPEMWGFVQLSDITAGEGKDKFIWNADENAKWVLRNIYYNEKTYYLNNQKYTDELSKLRLPETKIEGFLWPPEIDAATNIFEARLTSIDGSRIISIKNDGEISIQNKK